MHRTVPSANPSLRGRTSKVSMPFDNDGAVNDRSSSRTRVVHLHIDPGTVPPPPGGVRGWDAFVTVSHHRSAIRDQSDAGLSGGVAPLRDAGPHPAVPHGACGSM